MASSRQRASSVTEEIMVPSSVLEKVSGPDDRHLKRIANEYGVRLAVAQEVPIEITGPPEDVTRIANEYGVRLAVAQEVPIEITGPPEDVTRIANEYGVRLAVAQEVPIEITDLQMVLHARVKSAAIFGTMQKGLAEIYDGYVDVLPQNTVPDDWSEPPIDRPFAPQVTRPSPEPAVISDSDSTDPRTSATATSGLLEAPEPIGTSTPEPPHYMAHGSTTPPRIQTANRERSLSSPAERSHRQKPSPRLTQTPDSIYATPELSLENPNSSQRVDISQDSQSASGTVQKGFTFPYPQSIEEVNRSFGALGLGANGTTQEATWSRRSIPDVSTFGRPAGSPHLPGALPTQAAMSGRGMQTLGRPGLPMRSIPDVRTFGQQYTVPQSAADAGTPTSPRNSVNFGTMTADRGGLYLNSNSAPSERFSQENLPDIRTFGRSPSAERVAAIYEAPRHTPAVGASHFGAPLAQSDRSTGTMPLVQAAGLGAAEAGPRHLTRGTATGGPPAAPPPLRALHGPFTRTHEPHTDPTNGPLPVSLTPSTIPGSPVHSPTFENGPFALDPHTDVTIYSDGHTFHAHQSVLAAHSALLKSQFHLHGPAMPMIKLDYCNPDYVLRFLKVLYGMEDLTFYSADSKLLCSFYDISHRLGCFRLCVGIESLLTHVVLDEVSTFDVLDIATKYTRRVLLERYVLNSSRCSLTLLSMKSPPSMFWTSQPSTPGGCCLRGTF